MVKPSHVAAYLLLLSISNGVLADDSQYVTCGSAIKLHHTENSQNFYLTSDGQRIQGAGSSGQQLITASPESNQMSSLWLIKAGHNTDKPCPTGTKIKYDEMQIRLEHLETGANLHSHDNRSPLSRQQEVTGFGQRGEGDYGDNWIVVPKRGNTNEKYWKIGDDVALMHVDSEKFLGSTDQAMFTMQNCGRGCPVMGHLEVFGRARNDSFCTWRTETGIYISK